MGRRIGTTSLWGAMRERFGRKPAWLFAIALLMLPSLGLDRGVVRVAKASSALGRAGAVSAPPEHRVPRRSGALRLLTYNVAGLPSMLSASRPALNTPHVSPLLNHYDLVLAQEDFAYHEELIASALHLYQAAPKRPLSAMFGDGLALLSKLPLESDARFRWQACNGYLLALSDCFAEKGFSVAQLRLSPGASVSVLNVHADAGRSEGDVAARRKGFRQLADYIQEHLKGRALIVAGDTNLHESDARDMLVLRQFLAATGLREVCREFTCQGGNLDRVFYRGSSSLVLSALSWRADPRFVDASGEPLSDHLPMAATIEWRMNGPEQQRTAAVGRL